MMMSALMPLNVKKLLLSCILIASLAGCSNFPRNGPASSDISKQAEKTDYAATLNPPFLLFPLNAELIQNVNQQSFKLLPSYFLSDMAQRYSYLLGVDDELSIHIWEPVADGLFSTSEKKYTKIDSAIDADGKLYIPYIGRIHAVGLSIEQVRSVVEQRFAAKAIEPQVHIVLNKNMSNRVVVLGDVVNSSQFAIPAGGLRLSEVIALSGGTKEATYDTELTLFRGDKQGSIRIEDILKHQDNDLLLNGKDRIIVTHRPKTFTAFGAVSTNSQVKFASESITLSEALAKVGGLSDRLADTGGVFLFRFEPQPIFSIDEQTQSSSGSSNYPQGIATVYRLDFSQPDAFFLASTFQMRDKDIIYVANASAAEFNKFVSLVVGPLLSSYKGFGF